jgi:DNA polymerase bacteriophage-type
LKYGDLVPLIHGSATVLADFDFETFSAAGYAWNHSLRKWDSLAGMAPQNRGLKTVGTRAYVEHPTFQILLLAYDLKDGRGGQQWRKGDAPPFDLFEHIREGKLLEAHRSYFEFAVWNYHANPRLGWPKIDLAQMRCSAAKSRAWGLAPGLEDLGNILNIPNKKLAAGKRLIQKFTVPKNPTKTQPTRLRIEMTEPKEAADAALFTSYNMGDIISEAEVSLRVPDLTPSELRVWQADQRINDRGLGVDMVALGNCLAVVEQAYARYNAALVLHTGGEVTKVSQNDRLMQWVNARGGNLYNMQEETVAEEIKRHAPGTLLHTVLDLRQRLASASVKKFYSINAQQVNGRLYDLYSYHAAKPGRWTGNGPQPQNLYKGDFENIDQVNAALAVIATRDIDKVEAAYGDVLHAVNGVQRSMFIPAPGKKFLCSDYSAIEGVGTAMLAGETWQIEVFRTHGMIYEATAGIITGISLDEFREYKRVNKKHHPARQELGKPGALGSGFGGWIPAWKKFGADEFLTDDQIKEAILKWREKSPNIVEFWGGQTRGRFQTARPELFGLEGCAVAAILNPGAAYAHRGITYQVGGDDVLYCRLPSGRFISYHRPRLAPSTRDWANPWELEISYEGYNSNQQKGPVGWLRMKLYGGLQTENVVQATCRDLQARAIVALEDNGYPVVLHTHDEICSEVVPARSLAEFEAIMCDRPSWALDWPIKAGGWEGYRYGKFE